MKEILDYYLEQFNSEIKTIAHVGAHLGQEVKMYQQLNVEKIYLFEPLKNIFNELSKEYKDNKYVNLFNIALGEENFKNCAIEPFLLSVN